MTNTQQPTIPAEDGDTEALVRDIMQVPYSKSKAKKLIYAYKQRIAIESRIDELDSLDHNKQMFGDWQQVIEDRRAALTAQLSQLTQYKQSEREG